MRNRLFSKNSRSLSFWLLISLGLALVASLFVFENRQDLARHVIQVVAIWIPLAVLLNLPRLVRRWREVLVVLVSTAAALLVLNYVVGPFVLHRLVLPLYNLDVDHRTKPHPGVINQDGVRPDVPPEDYSEQDFVLVVLGDSFTLGVGVPSGLSFPSQIETILKSRYPDKPVRLVNFGWPSSSPVLQLRQLRQIGAKYKPDVVIQTYDMTDVHDDLSYSLKLRQADLEHPRELSILRAMEVRFSLLLGLEDVREWLRRKLVFNGEKEEAEVPFKRFFFMEQPLEKSEPFLKTSWDTIVETNAFAEEIGARYALFVLPRYQQFNRNECPMDPETKITESDKYILEIFRYFEKQSRTAAFPVYSLLADFRDSGVFPAVLEYDPHYSTAGNRIVAESVVRYLTEDGYLDDLS